jgi:ABC-type Fe3+-hydroxamate transport system substrate-binding protein
LDLQQVGGTKDPNISDIVELNPDLVVVDAEENRLEDYHALLARGINVHVLHIQSLGDVGPSIAALAKRIGAGWVPPLLPDPIPIRIRAFVPIWRRPWMALGAPTYGASLLSHLGVFTEFSPDGRYPKIALDDAIARQPDIVLAPSEPYPFTDRQRPELERVAPTIFVDGKDLFWWGTRTEDAVANLATIIGTL